MSIGKMIAEALQEVTNKAKRYGPELPLNFAAVTSLIKHRATLTEFEPQLKLALLEVKRLENRVEEEKARWTIEMEQLQPEMREGIGFEVNESGTKFRVVYEAKDDDKPILTVGLPTDWSENMKDKKLN